jgi:hypothetical protein
MADPNPKTEYTPDELRQGMSDFDPNALGREQGQPSPQTPGKSGAPPETTPEQERMEDKASEFRNNPERSRDDHLTRIGRGQQTHG